MEYLCKFESAASIGISKRGCHIVQYYRSLLGKSRDLCTRKMKNRISTNEECDFCGCTFALSFLRESVFQKPLLAAIRRGFIEWYHVTSQINSYRGIHNTRLHRTVMMILHEIVQLNFDSASCSSLEDYFSLCEKNSLESYRGLTITVKRKPIAFTFRPSNVSGNSETFYGNVLAQSPVISLENERRRNVDVHVTHSPPVVELRPTAFQENTDSCLRSYRRMSTFLASPLNEVEEVIDAETEAVNVKVKESMKDSLNEAVNNALNDAVNKAGSELKRESLENPLEEPDFLNTNDLEEIGVYYGSFANTEERFLRFEMLNPTLFLWPSIYSYVDSVVRMNEPIDKEDWFSLLMQNGNVYITFVNFYHQYVHSVVRGDIPWNQVPGYSDISITIPLMMMECRFQNRSLKEEMFSQLDFRSLDLNPFYSPHCFHLKNVSSDSHPILRSIRILPQFNPHITYPCIIAVFFSSNLRLAKDVSSYLTRAKELLRSLHDANLSYYSSAQQRCFDDSLAWGVIYANLRSIDSSLHELHELHSLPLLKGATSLPPSPVAENSPPSPLTSFKHSKSPTHSRNLWSLLPSLTKVARPMHPSHSDPSMVSVSPSITPQTPPLCETPIGMTVEVDTPPSLKLEMPCRTDFHDQIQNSLFNLSRVVTLCGLQFHQTLQTDNKEILTSVLATIYDLPTIVSEGDFHIFMNTVMFGSSKYLHRYDVSLSPSSHTKPVLKTDGYPNMLCRLFMHWSSDVRDYLHKLIVFRVMARRKGGLTDLELILTDVFARASNECSFQFNLFWDHDDYMESRRVDYELLGKTILAILHSDMDGASLKRLYHPNQMFSDYAERLAAETDLFLFLLLLNQYSGDYPLMRQHSMAAYFFDSVGRFCELLYRVHTDPMNTKAPSVLNMVFSNFGGIM